MTKTILLAAAAVAAMAFAGGATAGELTTGSKIAGDSIYVSSAVAPYTVARDFTLATAGIVTDNGTGMGQAVTNFTFSNTSNPVSLATSTDYVVTLTLTGPAKFEGQAASTVNFGSTTTTSTPILSADGKTLTIYARTAASGVSGTAASVNAAGFNVRVTGQDSVSVAYKLQQVVGSQTLDLDSSTAQEVIRFRNALTLYSGTTTSILAALPNFTAFQGTSGALTSGTFASTSNTAYNTDLKSTNVPAITSIITGYSATVTGPQVQDMLTSFDGIALASATNVTAGSATFTATSGADAVNLVLTPKANTAIQEGTYAAAISPTYAANWNGSALVNRNLVIVGLAGTNFNAPWFGFGGTAANSSLRIANNGTSATGAIVIQLRARNGSTATATSATFPAVAPNSFRTITGSELRTAFGTDAANGDLLVSIQSEANGSVSAKVRTTQPSGQIFENSLGLLEAPRASQSSVDAVQTTVNTINTNNPAPTVP